MGWREELAKTLLGKVAPVAAPAARRTDLPTRAYHGTNVAFPEFKNPSAATAGYLDRPLGTHVAKDPALSSAFADRWINPAKYDPTRQMVGSPHVLPLRIPAEDKFLQAVQPLINRDVPLPGTPLWRNVMMDEGAITRMVADAGYRKDPDMLARYLAEARGVPRPEAGSMARDLVAGETRPILGKPYDMNRFIKDFAGTPYNPADRQAIVDLARKGWEDQGYKGIRYINTAPTEAGATGVKDPTSYIVFNPANIRSEFARMDPAKIGSADLMSGVAGAAIVAPPVMSKLFEPQAFEEAR